MSSPKVLPWPVQQLIHCMETTRTVWWHFDFLATAVNLRPVSTLPYSRFEKRSWGNIVFPEKQELLLDIWEYIRRSETDEYELVFQQSLCFQVSFSFTSTYTSAIGETVFPWKLTGLSWFYLPLYHLNSFKWPITLFPNYSQKGVWGEGGRGLAGPYRSLLFLPCID